MSKGDDTRQAILGRAFELASVIGVSGLTIGRLAEEMGLSKSGLFAHFGSKEALDVAVVEEASRQFVQEVMVPALREPRGEPRVRALFDRWLAWGQRPGGCFFVGASAELDDRVGPSRDALARADKDWLDELAKAARIAVREGHFAADARSRSVRVRALRHHAELSPIPSLLARARGARSDASRLRSTRRLGARAVTRSFPLVSRRTDVGIWIDQK